MFRILENLTLSKSCLTKVCVDVSLFMEIGYCSSEQNVRVLM